MPAFNEAAPPLQPISRANYFSSLYENRPSIIAALKVNKGMCFTYNNPTNYFYRPHSDLGRVGTSSSAYQAQRKRI
jgi:hypothetical protein